MICVIIGCLLMAVAACILGRASYYDDKATRGYYPDQDAEFLSMMLYVVGYIILAGGVILALVGAL